MAQIELVSFSMRTTHILIKESVDLNGYFVPIGLLCGRKPRQRRFPRFGRFGDLLSFTPGDIHIYWGRMKFCKNCYYKWEKIHGANFSFTHGIPEVVPTVTNAAQSVGLGALTSK